MLSIHFEIVEPLPNWEKTFGLLSPFSFLALLVFHDVRFETTVPPYSIHRMAVLYTQTHTKKMLHCSAGVTQWLRVDL